VFDSIVSAGADQLLHVYLNDHRAGGIGARAVAERSRASNEGNGFGAFLGWFVEQLDEDLEQLDRVVARCGGRVSPAKMLGARMGAEAGRLKLNGRLWSYSPLSRVLEFELLRSGVAGKTQLWQTIDALGPDHPASMAIDVKDLLRRAEQQAAQLTEMSAKASLLAFAASGSDMAS
jgi:hypothetical protein